MKIDYLRNMQSGFMRIALEEPLSKTEEEMLSHNVIEGILPFQWQKEDNRYLLCYDITGKQALDSYIESEPVDEKLLGSLLAGIFAAVRQLEKHLLSQDGLLLLPETIFWDYKTETMGFCYYPGEEESLQERFRSLMEYLLAKTDHKNVLAVQLVYGVYEELLKPSFCLSEVQKYMLRQREADEGAETPVLRREESRNDTEIPVAEPDAQTGHANKGQAERMYEKIMAWVKERLERFIKRKPVMETIVFEPEEEEKKQGLPTILLAEKAEDVEGILKYEGNHLLPNLRIVKLPFIIGSGRECDGQINHPTISRQHAKITCREDVYFIEDLNSTNGTRVDGGLLNYKTKVSLRKNESIYFANEPYRFL